MNNTTALTVASQAECSFLTIGKQLCSELNADLMTPTANENRDICILLSQKIGVSCGWNITFNVNIHVGTYGSKHISQTIKLKRVRQSVQSL